MIPSWNPLEIAQEMSVKMFARFLSLVQADDIQGIPRVLHFFLFFRIFSFRGIEDLCLQISIHIHRFLKEFLRDFSWWYYSKHTSRVSSRNFSSRLPKCFYKYLSVNFFWNVWLVFAFKNSFKHSEANSEIVFEILLGILSEISPENLSVFEGFLKEF